MKKLLRDYDESLDLYIPVLMAQAKIYWDLEHYSMVEKVVLSCIFLRRFFIYTGGVGSYVGNRNTTRPL